MDKLELYNNIAKSRGGRCLSAVYENCKEHLLWECGKGHQWEATPDNIKRGTWCPHCAGLVKHDLQWCQELAEKKKGKCLSVEYKNSHDASMLWECKEGHQWNESVNHIRRGVWCPSCAGNKKKDLGWCQEFARNKNGKCLSVEYKNSKEPMLWECEKGHQWITIVGSIVRGSWCPDCSGNKTKDLSWCKELAANRAGKCLSVEYKNSHECMLWECKEGHQWRTNANSIQRGTWCMICGRLEGVKKLGISYTLLHWKTGEEIMCQGSYEKRAVEYFNTNKINYAWQSQTFAMPDGRTYRPDLFLCSEDKWIEIKGYFWGDAEEKWNWFRTEHPNSELWNKEKLTKMGIL